MAKGLLLVAFDFTNAHEDEFHDWYDLEHIPPGDADSPAGAGGLLVNAMNVTPEREAEFNEGYNHEHIPALAAVPGVLSARRFRDPRGTHRYLALYHLQSPE